MLHTYNIIQKNAVCAQHIGANPFISRRDTRTGVVVFSLRIELNYLVKHRPLMPRGDLWLKEMPSMSYPDRLYGSWR